MHLQGQAISFVFFKLFYSRLKEPKRLPCQVQTRPRTIRKNYARRTKTLSYAPDTVKNIESTLPAKQRDDSSYGSKEKVSNLDKNLIAKYGMKYLIQFCEEVFQKRTEDIRVWQVQQMISRLESYIWSDLDSSFIYLEKDVPPCKLTGDRRIKIANFAHLNSFQAASIDDPWLTFRRRLCYLLQDYCEDPEVTEKNAKIIPEKHRLYLVKVPSWAQIDKYMYADKSEALWRQERKPHRRTNEEEDGWQAGKWFRGIMLGVCGKSATVSECFEFRLIDVGRFVAIHRTNIRPAVWRFVQIPALAFEGALVLFKPSQICAENLREKWYTLFDKGTVIPVTVVHRVNSLIYVRMPYDTEVEFDKKYETLYPEKAQEIKPQENAPWSIPSRHIKTFDESIFT